VILGQLGLEYIPACIRRSSLRDKKNAARLLESSTGSTAITNSP